MKLKKVVSLALAGVMAVSMLAGCGTKKEEPTQDDTGAVKTGYSAEFAKIADLDMDNVTFKDSTVDQAALQAAVDSCTDVQLYTALVVGTINGPLNGATWITDGLVPATTVFADKAGLDENSYNVEGYFTTNKDKKLNQTLKMGGLIAVDGTMSTDAVLKMVAKMMEDSTVYANLPESGLDVDANNGYAKYYYDYTISVSIVSRTTTMSDAVKADMDFVAVTITRTGTSAEQV